MPVRVKVPPVAPSEVFVESEPVYALALAPDEETLYVGGFSAMFFLAPSYNGSCSNSNFSNFSKIHLLKISKKSSEMPEILFI